MAKDIADLLNALAIQRADVLGHDRGARVAYRFALDHPGRINKLGIIEIVPTADFWASWTADLAITAYHWTFLAQPFPLPERMIGADPVAYLDWTLAQWTLGKSLKTFSPAALASYRHQVQNPARVHAMCSDYRAGASFDRELDEKIKSLANRLWLRYGYSAVPMVFQPKVVMPLRFGAVGLNEWRRVFAMPAIS